MRRIKYIQKSYNFLLKIMLYFPPKNIYFFILVFKKYVFLQINYLFYNSLSFTHCNVNAAAPHLSNRKSR